MSKKKKKGYGGMYKGLMGDVMGLTKGSLALGVGADVVTRAGGDPAGLTAFSSYLTPMGSIAGLKYTTKALKKVKY